MLMHPVSSSDIASIGYDNGTLYIAFISGGVYSYTGVPESIFQNLMSAGSHGKYFHANIKNNYPYSRIG